MGVAGGRWVPWDVRAGVRQRGANANRGEMEGSQEPEGDPVQLIDRLVYAESDGAVKDVVNLGDWAKRQARRSRFSDNVSLFQ